MRRWTKAEYYKLAELGVIPERGVELMNGEIIDMPPIGQGHATSVVKLNRLLLNAFPNDLVRPALPYDAADDSEPEPDFAVVPGHDPRTYSTAHPRSSLLIIEVADSSLAYDRGRKASRYAASGIADYWVLNLPAPQLEVFRDPQPSTQHEFGFGYASHTIVGANGTISPLAAPAVVLAVKDMLP